MTAIQRHDRIKSMQDECDRIIEGCEAGDCCPCPTCAALEDVLKALTVARTCAEAAADVIEWPMAEVA